MAETLGDGRSKSLSLSSPCTMKPAAFGFVGGYLRWTVFSGSPVLCSCGWRDPHALRHLGPAQEAMEETLNTCASLDAPQ